MSYPTEEIKTWCETQTEQVMDLLHALGRLPAPSHNEERRAAFIREWLLANGAEYATVDEAKNVILRIGDFENGPISIVMAHTDIVFPDTDLLPMREENGSLYAPGIGDDTANLVNLLFAAKYLLEKGIMPERGGLLIAANSCEEGLGNLKGSRKIMSEYAGRARRMISLDLYTGKIVTKAVGSHRYRITVKTAGGHSYGDFGNDNAIAQMAEIVTALYAKKVPEQAKTTYNIGVITGGTTVNSICSECEILYEYRSEARECLEEMKAFFEETIEFIRRKGFAIEIEQIGDRPCTGDVDERQERELENAAAQIITACTGKPPVSGEAASTDCNAALAMGIPSICTGTVEGAALHTREEWIDPNSMSTGLLIAVGLLLYCCRN